VSTHHLEHVRDTFPPPIAMAWAKYLEEGEAAHAVPQLLCLLHLVDTYEALIKYAAVLAVQNFYAVPVLVEEHPKIDALIRTRITRPALGHWSELLREVLRCFASHEDLLFCRDLFLWRFQSFGTSPKDTAAFANGGPADRLSALRNEYVGHGATVTDDHAQGLVQQHHGHLEALCAHASFMGALPLWAIQEQNVAAQGEPIYLAKPLMGAGYLSKPIEQLRAPGLVAGHVGHVVAQHPQSGTWLDLHPLVLYTECVENVPLWDRENHQVRETPCKVQKVLFYNDLKDERRIGYLDYWQGHHSRFRDQHASSFREHFPRPQGHLADAGREHPFDAFMEERTATFVGRDEDLGVLNLFVEQGGKRALVILGPPGMGKTALLARWSQDYAEQTAVHFLREGDAATTDPAAVLESLARQVSARLKKTWQATVAREPADLRKRLVGLLQEAGDKRVALTLVIDGLDEAVRSSSTGGRSGEQTVLEWLPAPEILPVTTRLVLTTRPELLDHPSFKAKFGTDKAQHHDLQRLSPAEIRALLYQVRSKYEVLKAAAYLDTIVARSEGNPLYVTLLMEDLAEERQIFGDVESLPTGLIAYFGRILTYIQQEGRRRDQPNVQALLNANRTTYEGLVAKGKLSRTEADELMQPEQDALEQQGGVRAVELLALYCLLREPLPLTEAATIMEQEPEQVLTAYDIIRTVLTGDAKHRLSIFHSAFKEYVLRLEKYSDSGVQPFTTVVQHARDALLAWCGRWSENESSYALRHYADHLAEVGRWKDVYHLASEGAGFLERQVRALPDNPQAPLRTLRRALEGAIVQEDAGFMATFMLAHAHRVDALTHESPLEELRLHGLERAWELANAFEVEEWTCWVLMLAWECADTGREQNLQRIQERLQERPIQRLSNQVAEEIAQGWARQTSAGEPVFAAIVIRLLSDAWLAEIIPVMLELHSLHQAREVAQGIADPQAQAQALGEIAGVQARGGDMDGAHRSLADALEVARRIADPQVQAQALGEIAVAQARGGDMDGALVTARRIVEPWAQARALGDIVVALAESEDVDGPSRSLADALKVARRIAVPKEQAEALGKIAVAQARGGNMDEARRSRADALEAARRIVDPQTQARVLGEIAATQARGGDMDGALVTARRIVEPWAQARVLGKIAEAQAQGGDMDGALKTARRIADPQAQAGALREIAVAQAT